MAPSLGAWNQVQEEVRLPASLGGTFRSALGGLFICSLDQELPRAGTVSCSFMNVALVLNTVPDTLYVLNQQKQNE